MANKTVYPFGTDGQLPSSIGIINDLTTGGTTQALSAEQGKVLNGYTQTTPDDVAMILAGQTATDNYPSGYQSGKGRIRVLFNVTAGCEISASCSLGKGVSVNVYGSRKDAITANYNNATQVINESNFVADTVTAKMVGNGILSVSLAKSDNSNFSEQEYGDYLDALEASVSLKGVAYLLDATEQQQAEIDDLKLSGGGQDNTLFLGQLAQKSMDATGGLSDTNAQYRVTTQSCMVLPKEGATLHFILPNWAQVGIREGDTAVNLNNNNFWFGNGDTFTFRDGMHYWRLSFAKIDYTHDAITVAEVTTAIANGEIKILVEDADFDIVAKNKESEKYVKAAMRNFVSGASNNGSLHKLPTIAHTSDVHGDATRFNSFADYCDYIGVDCALVSGDMVAYNPSNTMQYINDVADTHNTMMLQCMGNHDALNLTTAEAQYNGIMKYLVEKNEVTTNPSEDYPTYFYKDFTSKKIRIFSINIYENGLQSNSAYFSQAQCEWLISSLASTPQDYGVLIMFHSPEKMPSKDNDHAVFYQDIVNYTGLQDGITGNPFSQIVDAFIGKTSATITYKNGFTQISVSADFTNLASGVEFIAFVNGHLHVDRIGYSPSTTYKQLNLNVCCGIAIYGSTYAYLANNSDLPRGCDGSTQDCFNIYAIDRGSKSVRIAKVGSNIAGNLTERKYMVIPYAD